MLRIIDETQSAVSYSISHGMTVVDNGKFLISIGELVVCYLLLLFPL